MHPACAIAVAWSVVCPCDLHDRRAGLEETFSCAVQADGGSLNKYYGEARGKWLGAVTSPSLVLLLPRGRLADQGQIC